MRMAMVLKTTILVLSLILFVRLCLSADLGLVLDEEDHAGDDLVEDTGDFDLADDSESRPTSADSFFANFNIKSLRDCNNRHDLINIRRLFYNRTITVPGLWEVNSTVVVKDKLPVDWNIKTSVHVKNSWLGWIRIPHSYDKKFKNVCNEKNIERCVNVLSKVNYEHNCKCDLDAGTYVIPSVQLPLKVKTKSNGKLGFRKSMLKNYLSQKGSEFKIESVLYSSQDGKRFGCVRAQFITI